MNPKAGKVRPTKAHRAWAAEVLGLNPALPADDLRAAALKSLHSSEFALWPQADLAVRVIAGGDDCRFQPADLVVLADVQEVRLRRAVSGLCREFLELSVDQRLQRLESLREVCAPYPMLRMRLSQLLFGAQVERPPLSDSADADLAQLVHVIWEYFLAWPAEAARIRRSALTQLPRPRWKQAAWRLYREHAAVHALAPDLISALCGHAYVPDWAVKAQAAKRTKSHLPKGSATSGAPAKGRNFAAYLVVALLVGLVRFLASTGDGPARSQPPLTPFDRKAWPQLNQQAFSPPELNSEQINRLRGSLQPPDGQTPRPPDMRNLLEQLKRDNPSFRNGIDQAMEEIKDLNRSAAERLNDGPMPPRPGTPTRSPFADSRRSEFPSRPSSPPPTAPVIPSPPGASRP